MHALYKSSVSIAKSVSYAHSKTRIIREFDHIQIIGFIFSRMEFSKQELPKDFIARMSCQIDDIEEFIGSLESDSPTFIRLNRSKYISFKGNIEGERLDWNEDGIRLGERPKFNVDPLYQSGLYYPMEGSSMFLKHVLKFVPLKRDDVILDLCAAPGGKSLIIKDFYPDNFLVSNEIETKRAHILKENVIRWGTDDHLVINSDAGRIAQSGCKFDLVLVDAPCSGEGLFRKDEKSRSEWSLERASGCAVRQNTILDEAIELLNSGAYLIYSTCTYNPDENMNQIKRLVSSGEFESIEFEVPKEWRIERMEEDGCFGYQFYPHRIQGEGFFISLLRYIGSDGHQVSFRAPKLKKELRAIPEAFNLNNRSVVDLNGFLIAFSDKDWYYYNLLKSSGNIVKKGLYVGEFKGVDFIPSHDLSMHKAVSNYNPKLELNEAQAVQYLKGNALQLLGEKGIVMLVYHGVPIGFGKSNGTRINNLIPKHLRI